MARSRSPFMVLAWIPLLAWACGDDAEVATPGAGGSGGSGGLTEEQLVERGDYLVNHVSVCVDCHTPRNMDGSLDMENLLAGSECFVDVAPEAEGAGCLHSPNLTDHETGLRNRSDQEIKDMLLQGERPNGEYLHAVMPYWVFGNMTDQDADAIVAYLRTVEGVDRTIPDHEPPWDERPAAAANRIDLALVPAPEEGDADFDAAMRGRYLATQAGVCMECHTPENPPGSADPLVLDMAFAGGREFPIAPGFVAQSANLTPHATGIEDYTVDDIVRVLHEGLDIEDEPICPPMPVGPMGAFAGLTDQDAEDIATYVLTLPPIENEVEDCKLPMPGGGGAGGAPSGAGGAGGG